MGLHLRFRAVLDCLVGVSIIERRGVFAPPCLVHSWRPWPPTVALGCCAPLPCPALPTLALAEPEEESEKGKSTRGPIESHHTVCVWLKPERSTTVLPETVAFGEQSVATEYPSPYIVFSLCVETPTLSLYDIS